MEVGCLTSQCQQIEGKQSEAERDGGVEEEEENEVEEKRWELSGWKKFGAIAEDIVTTTQHYRCLHF